MSASRRTPITRFILTSLVLALLGELFLSSTASALPPPPPPTSSGISLYHPVDPARVYDSRSATRLGAGESRLVRIAGVSGLPASGISAVVANVTAVRPGAGGYLTVHPSDSARPSASNLNFTAGRTVANLVTVKAGTDGRIRIVNGSSAPLDVIVDVNGWYQAVTPFGPANSGSSFRSMDPVRVHDSRTAGGRLPVGPGRSIKVKVAGVAGVSASGVSAVVANVTAVTPTGAGYLTVFPSGAGRPATSSLNFGARETVPNLVVGKVGADGAIEIHNGSGGTVHVLVDVAGWYERSESDQAGPFVPMTPARVLDTRAGVGAPAGRIGAGRSISLRVHSAGGLPSNGVRAVVANVTVISPAAAGHLSVAPSGVGLPKVSNLNFVAGRTVPNLVVTRVGSDGRIVIHNGSAGSVDVAVDLAGYVASGGELPPGLPPASVSDGPAQQGSLANASTVDIDVDLGVAPTAGRGTQPATDDAADRSAESTEAHRRQLEQEPGVAESTPALGMVESAGNEVFSSTVHPTYQVGYQFNPPAYFGRLYSDQGRCSASVVARNLIITAAHCVLASTSSETSWSTQSNLRFVPQQWGTEQPKGVWYAQSVTIPTAYVTCMHRKRADCLSGADIAYIVVNEVRGGKLLGDHTGVMPMMFNAPAGWHYSMGYPSEGSVFSEYCNGSACYPRFCMSAHGDWYQNAIDNWYGYRWYTAGYGCDMTGGSSGGPSFTYVSGRWYITGINSHVLPAEYDAVGSCPTRQNQRCIRRSANMYSPWLSTAASEIYYSLRVA